MRFLRRSLTCCWLIILLSACGGVFAGRDCFEPRGEGACLVIDGGVPLRFALGEPDPDYAALCSARCVEFPQGGLTIIGYSDLKKVPGLSKVKSARTLFIQADSLPSLAGLESIDEIGTLEITQESPADSALGSLDQLPKRVSALQLTGLYKLQSLPTPLLVTRLGLNGTGIVDFDVNSSSAEVVGLQSNANLIQVQLPARGTIKALGLSLNPVLKDLRLPSGSTFRVTQRLDIFRNPQLSSCLADQVGQALTPFPDQRSISMNGPCP